MSILCNEYYNLLVMFDSLVKQYLLFAGMRFFHHDFLRFAFTSLMLQLCLGINHLNFNLHCRIKRGSENESGHCGTWSTEPKHTFRRRKSKQMIVVLKQRVSIVPIFLGQEWTYFRRAPFSCNRESAMFHTKMSTTIK